MTTLPCLTIRTTTPCCKRAVRLTALIDVPVEKYDRTCTDCGFAWRIERRFVKATDEARFDVLEWTK